uniref:Uncharacterized protein n=1 Tax=Geladintestivirus 5 TaxID=3233137 RepID=A0AAU8MG69_9CAUD
MSNYMSVTFFTGEIITFSFFINFSSSISTSIIFNYKYNHLIRYSQITIAIIWL